MKKCNPLLLLTAVGLLFLSGCSNTQSGGTGEAEQTGERQISDQTAINESTDQAPQTDETPGMESFRITIPDLSREYRFLYITDAHMVSAGENESEEIQNYANERMGSFTAEDGKTAVMQFEKLLSSLSVNSYDGLLLGGDLIDSPSASNLAYLENLFTSVSLPYLYTPGNHDWTFPWEYMTPEGRTKYLEPLSSYMDGNSAIHYLELEEFILAAVDNSSNQIDPASLDEYKTLLQGSKPIILLLHVPLMTDSLLEEAKKLWNSGVVLGGGVNGGIYPNEQSAEFIRLTTQADSPVAAILAGHVHFTHTSQVQGEKSIPQYVGGPGFLGIATEIMIQ